MIQNKDYYVKTFNLLSKGISEVKKNIYDVILLDLGLPDSKGKETLENFREFFDEIPVIVLTGWDDKNVAKQALEAGAQDFLVKGKYNADLLMKTIIYSIERARARKVLKDLSITMANSQEQLKQIIETMNEGIVIVDPKNKICFLNQAAEKLLGQKREDFSSVSLPFLLKEESQQEIELIREDGNKAILTLTKTIIMWKGKKAFLITLHDLTEQRIIEENMFKIQKLESVGTLAGGIAHDFNNLLSSVLGNISMARLKVKPCEEIYEYLLDIEKAAVQARNLTKKLLVFSKGGEPVKKIFSMKEMLIETVDFILKGSIARPRFSIADNLFPVKGDSSQIAQVIDNLLINAVSAMNEGGIIDVSAENTVVNKKDIPGLDTGHYIKISIKDCGQGIPKENLSKIFDPYFTTKKDGTGLGLAMAYSIIRKHGGAIIVESEVGKGSVCTVYLPAVLKTRQTSVKKRVKMTQGAGRILVMEDDLKVQKTMGKILNILGFEVCFAQDGKKTEKLFRKAIDEKKPFDAVIMDLIIQGGLGGKNTINKIKQIDPEVKAIVSSGYSDDPVMADYKEYGFVDVLPKPYTIEEMSGVLNRVLKR
ncbi:MAG: response regulator [Spirochaetes bacterium]|nr:response regulator [Spirochaetota bacterium]